MILHTENKRTEKNGAVECCPIFLLIEIKKLGKIWEKDATLQFKKNVLYYKVGF